MVLFLGLRYNIVNIIKKTIHKSLVTQIFYIFVHKLCSTKFQMLHAAKQVKAMKRFEILLDKIQK